MKCKCGNEELIKLGTSSERDGIRGDRYCPSCKTVFYCAAHGLCEMTPDSWHWTDEVGDAIIEKGIDYDIRSSLEKTLDNLESEVKLSKQEIAAQDVITNNCIQELKRLNAVEEKIKRELERAYQMLEVYGVPRERAKSVANGIDVLATRLSKEVKMLENEVK